MAELPVWLRKSFVRAVQEAGSPLSAEELEAPFISLIERWSDPARRFHGVVHVATCVSRLEKLISEVRHPAATTLAMWYHGVAFDTSPNAAYAGMGGENEERSAQIARAELVELGVPEATADLVGMLILGMRYPVAAMSKPGDFAIGTAPGTADAVQHHRKDDALSPDSVDIIALRDAHLADLAAAPQAYKKYLTAVREEYPEIPEEKFLRARLHIVNHFLARKHLFATPGSKMWEDHARQNLTAEAGRIAARLSEYDRRNADSADADATSQTAPAAAKDANTASDANAAAHAEATAATHADDETAGTRYNTETHDDAPAANVVAQVRDDPWETEPIREQKDGGSVAESSSAEGKAEAGEPGAAELSKPDEQRERAEEPERAEQPGGNAAASPTETTEIPAISSADPESMKLSTLEWCVDQLLPSLESRPPRVDLPARTDRARREEVSTKTLEAIARRTREAQEARAQRQARDTNANSPLADKQRVAEARGESAEEPRD